MTDLAGLRWWGGKHPMRADGLGSWVASQIPRLSWYVEPFAGMLGVLLQRTPSKREIVNDLDGRVPNWWRVVRDQPDELIEALAYTPRSRHEWGHCKQAQWDTDLDDVERARCFTVFHWQGRSTQDRWNPDTRRLSRHGLKRDSLTRRIEALADRIRDVDIEQTDALDLIDRFADNDDAVVYCDPPYRSDIVGARMYDRHHYLASIDHDAMQTRLVNATAQVAVSGNPGDYPILTDAGWHEITTERHVANTRPNERATKTRPEALVCNFQPAAELSLL